MDVGKSVSNHCNEFFKVVKRLIGFICHTKFSLGLIAAVKLYTSFSYIKF